MTTKATIRTNTIGTKHSASAYWGEYPVGSSSQCRSQKAAIRSLVESMPDMIDYLASTRVDLERRRRLTLWLVEYLRGNVTTTSAA